jgi:hypothetical protein
MSDPKPEISGMVGFPVFSGFIVALGEANRRSHDELEQNVKDRTTDLTRAKQELEDYGRELS